MLLAAATDAPRPAGRPARQT